MLFLRITNQQYKTGLETLVDVALTQNSRASEAAAEVVLSLNNGGDWMLDLCKLHSLDDHNYAAVMNAINGKMKFQTDPQYIINNGDAVLAKIKERYEYLKIKKN